jgi:hypothetical protein
MPVDQPRRLWGVNAYRRVFSTGSVGRARDVDLFDGVRVPAADRLAEAA